MWLYFDKVTIGAVKVARCKDKNCESHINPEKYCELMDNSTTSLWRHLRSNHPETAALEDDMQAKKIKLRQEMKKEAADKLSRFVFKPNPQLQLSEYVQSNLPKYQKAHPKQKRFHRNLKNMMKHDAQPFKMANSQWFRRLVKDLDNRVTVKSRHSYSKEIKKEGRIMKRRSREHCKQNITLAYSAAADMWTSKDQTDFLGINALFIDSSWRWQKITVACHPFEEKHSGENLRKMLKEESDALELGEDVIKVYVTDTASDIVAGRKVPGYSAISCCIHKLQRLGSDAENTNGTEEVAAALKAARKVVTHSRHCGPFHRTMKKYCKKNNHNPTKLIGHVKTRWNSNKMMISRLLQHRTCIQGMENDEAVPNMPIIEVAQWRILKQLLEILSPMERTTKVWESETEPTMSRVGVEVYNLNSEWEEMIKKEQAVYLESSLLSEPSVLVFLKSLHFNLHRRFPELGMDTDLAAWGNILHPRYKVEKINSYSGFFFKGFYLFHIH
jgi:hypothetical protein